MLSHAKIGKFHRPNGVYKNVGSLDIPAKKSSTPLSRLGSIAKVCEYHKQF
jgi:hypothetical protein